jgi:hypothetical protein
MAIVNLNGSLIMTGLAADPVELGGPGIGDGAVRSWVETVEVGAADSATSTYLMARLPSNARILGASKLYTDDLASAGAPTLDIGVFNRTGKTNITDDPDALNDGIDAATVTDTAVIKDIANYGKRLWEHVNGQTEDPKADLDIKITLADADVNVGGTMTIELFYTLD